MGRYLTRKRFLQKTAETLGGLFLGNILLETPGMSQDPPPGSQPERRPYPSPLPLRFDWVGKTRSFRQRVRGLAFDREGRLYVAGRGGVTVVDRQGRPIRDLPAERQVYCVEVDEEDDVFLGLRNRVLKYDPTGHLVDAWGKGKSDRNRIGFLTGMAVSGGVLYLADAGDRKIRRWAVDGDPIDSWEGFHIPSAYFDCCADEKRNLYVTHTAEHRVEQYDANGRRTASWGTYGSTLEAFCGCCNPTNLTLLQDGNLATAEKGIPRIKVYSSSGRLLAYLGPRELGLQEDERHLGALRGPGNRLPCHDNWPGMPLAVSPDGKLAVAVPGTGEIRFYRIEPA